MKVKFDTVKAHQRYKLADGTAVPGGSTIAKLATANESQGALIHWAWKLGQDGIDYKKSRDKAADAGSVAHFMIECHLKGDEPDLSGVSKDTQDKAENAVIKFLSWWDKSGYKAIACEREAVSEEYKFGGTLDILAQKPDGTVALIDLKTSSGIYLAHWVQVAGYALLCPEDVKSVVICRIGREEDMSDFEVQERVDITAEREVFLTGVQLYYDLKACKAKGK
jgi:hypothetical protein